MIIVLFLALGAMLAYQLEKPCDDACFKAKIAEEVKKQGYKEEPERDNEDWRRGK